MTEGRIVPLLIRFALPMMLGGIFQQFYTVVDTMVVGKALGVGALAAVGATDWFNWTVLGILVSFPQGFAIRMAQEFGARNYEQLRKVVAHSVVLSVAGAVVVTVASQVFTLPVLHLLGTPADILPDAVTYIRVIFCGIPVVMAYNLFACTLRSLGNARTPLVAVMVSSVTNILLDLLFVLVFRWGIAGAAFATIIAQFLSAVVCFLAIRKIPFLYAKNLLRKKIYLQPDWQLSKQLLSLSTPLALQYTLIHVGGMILQAVINGFGVLFIAGFTATNKLYGMLEIAASSYGSAMMTFAGQNLGARNLKRIKQGHRYSNLIGIVTSVVISVIMLSFGKTILGLFISGTPEQVEETLAIAYRYLSILSAALPTLYLLYVTRSCVQGLGNTVLPMVSGFAECVMRLMAALILPMYIGEFGIFLAEPFAWIGADVILISSYFITMKKTRRMLEKEEEKEVFQ